jgi:hypothetical protein
MFHTIIVGVAILRQSYVCSAGSSIVVTRRCKMLPMLLRILHGSTPVKQLVFGSPDMLLTSLTTPLPTTRSKQHPCLVARKFEEMEIHWIATE